jgi:hypothetical protein
MGEETIVNKIANSNLSTLDLEEYYTPGVRAVIDIKDQLFKGLILKEKDFREYVKTTDWAKYKDQFVAVYCSTDAVIPTWAYMLISSRLQPFAKRIVFGNLEALENVLYLEALAKIDPAAYQDTRLIIKGCGNLPVPAGAYLEITRILSPVVKSIMFGEPCSTVPVLKN